MKAQWFLVRGLVLVLTLALVGGAGPGLAQGTGQQQPASIQAASSALAPQAQVGTAFTYQGQIESDSSPVNGTCDMQFALYDTASGGAQIGTTQTANNVSVTDGLFTAQLDFGSNAFNGDARWLDMAVRCPAGGGSYTPLTPRQALSPAPYALALPGLYTQQTSGSPDIIGGYSGNNIVITNTEGATIGGGGANGLPNRIFVSGGTASFATIGGGVNNAASGYLSTIGGGANNVVTDTSTTVGGGWTNTAGRVNATVAGGALNTASGEAATVGGGECNTASGKLATISGGGHNYQVQCNTASGDYSVIPGGTDNLAAGAFSFAAGRHAKASHQGAFVWADSTDAAFASTANDQFAVRALGGVYVLTSNGAWRIETNAISPNIIGGYNSNGAMAGVVGATIAGGGESGYPNSVTDKFCTIGGGSRNQAGNGNSLITDTAYSTVGGGYSNIANGMGTTIGGGYGNAASSGFSTVGGGQNNSASGGNHSTVAGGFWNLASGGTSTVGGGFTNSAGNAGATVSGGENNSAGGVRSTIGGGAWNTASGWTSTISGGDGHTANGTRATIGGGYGNLAGGDYATVPGGGSAAAPLYGQMAYASGPFAARGDAQTSVYVLRNTSTMTGPVELYLNGVDRRLTIDISRTLTFDALVVARSDTGDSAGYQIRGVVENYSGATSFIGTPTVTTLGEDVATWDISILANDTNDALVIQATGAASTTIRWVVTVRTVEVSW